MLFIGLLYGGYLLIYIEKIICLIIFLSAKALKNKAF